MIHVRSAPVFLCMVVSYAGEAAVSGVSLVNQLNTIFIYLFTALASGGAVIISQYIGRREHPSFDVWKNRGFRDAGLCDLSENIRLFLSGIGSL